MEIDPASLFDAMPIPLVVVSPELTVVTANHAFEKLMGFSRQKITGRSVLEFFRGGPSGEMARSVREALERVLERKQSDFLPVRRYDVEDPNRPGEMQERYLYITHTPMLDDKGDVVAIFTHLEDATELVRQRHKDLKKQPPPNGGPLTYTPDVEAHLEAQANRLYEINQQLHRYHLQDQQAIEALRGAVQQQRETLAAASHDLRNPLAGLLVRLQDALDDPEADSRKVLEAALHDAERLSDIVADLLELARLEAGTPAETRPVDLARLVDDELSRLTLKTPIAAHLEPGVVVAGSSVRLARLVDNLLANADRHADSQVQVTVHADGDTAVLEVVDDGPGIPDEEKEKVFQRFYRRADAQRSDPGGTGLGLAICRQIAETHGGTLQAADRPDGTSGACFILRLPRKAP